MQRHAFWLQVVLNRVEHGVNRGTQGSQANDRGDGYKAKKQTVLDHGCSTLITDESSYYFGQN